MGVLIDGVWTDGTLPEETGKTGEFKRKDSSFRNWITADGSSGFKAEAGRYHLYVAHACPWAHRTLIYRALKKLDDAITVSYSVPGIRAQGWTFQNDPKYPDCTPDTVNGFNYLHQAYTAADPKYTGKVTVPTLWDKKQKTIVNDELSEIIRMLNSEFNAIGGDNADYYPPALRAEIDADEREDLFQRQQRGLSRRLRQDAGGLRGGLRRLVRNARRTGDAARQAALSGRQADHRGRLAAASDPTALRRRLLLDLQVQQEADQGLSRTCGTTCSSSTTCRASRRR